MAKTEIKLIDYDGDEEKYFNFNAEVLPHPTSTFYVRAKGQSMRDVGIFDGDILIVDKSLEPDHGTVIIAMIDNEFTVKRFEMIGNRPYLVAANPDYPPIPLVSREFQVWGIVTHAVHSFNK